MEKKKSQKTKNKILKKWKNKFFNPQQMGRANKLEMRKKKITKDEENMKKKIKKKSLTRSRHGGQIMWKKKEKSVENEKKK